MKSIRLSLVSLAAATTLLCALPASAQTGPAPYGAPISLEQAKKAMAAAEAEARKNNWQVVISIVDAGGHLLLFERLDGSFPASATVAIEKAKTAALFKFESKKLEDAINGGRDALITVGYTFLQGGVPIIYNGQVVGAIGVSGAKSADQDREIATAGAGVVLN